MESESRITIELILSKPAELFFVLKLLFVVFVDRLCVLHFSTSFICGDSIEFIKGLALIVGELLSASGFLTKC